MEADLTGVFSPHACGFIWENANIWKRTNSDSPHDYFVANSSGACLASSCRYATARYDPATRELRFSPTAASRFGPRWLLLYTPVTPSDEELRDDTARFGHEPVGPGWTAIATHEFISRMQTNVNSRFVEQYQNDEIDANDLRRLCVESVDKYESCGLLVKRQNGRGAATAFRELTHGSVCDPSRLTYLDDEAAAEERRQRRDGRRLLLL